MKRFVVLASCLAAAMGLTALVGCDWTSNGTDYNTSRGAGANVNWTGTYFGQLSGGRAVSSTSGGPITRLVIFNSANALEITDNNGSKYTGKIGAPGVVANPVVNTETGEYIYPAGAQIVQSQVTFTGKDEIAAKDIEFVGVIHVVTVDDVTGTTTEDTTTSTESSGTNNTQTIIIEEPAGDGTTNIITIVKPDPNAKQTTRDVTSTSSSSFTLTEANSQYRLQGTWIEQGGGRANVDALSPGSVGSVTTTVDPL